MNNWFVVNDMRMSAQLSEDVHAPELRNPENTAIRKGKGWLARLLTGERKACACKGC